jgi:cell division protein FtsN
VNSPKLRLSAAAFAALTTFAALTVPPADASLAAHPEPAKLDTSLPKPPVIIPAPATPPAPSPVVPPAAPLLPKAVPSFPKADKPSVPFRPTPGREEITSLARKGLLDSALGLCAIALDSAPNDPFLLLMMGKLSPGGKESSEYFKKAIKAGANSAEAEESLFRLGQFHYATGKYYLAIPFFRDYLRLFPKGDWKEPAAYWMGNACLSLAQGRPDRAAYLDSGMAWFQKLLDRTRPEDYYHPLALEGLAKVKAFKGDREGAWQAAKTALEKAPEEEQSPLLLLAAQLRQGVDRNDEKAYMAQLVGRYPQSPEARYLRKLNAGLDTAKWKAGSGLPRPAPAAAKDSSTVSPVAPGTAAARPADTAATAAPKLPAVAPKLPTAAAPVPVAAQKFTLQVGAFSQASNAQAMMANLTKVGVAPELVESSRAGKPIYQVRVGRFSTSEEAAEFAKTRLKPHRFLSQPVPIAP